MGCPRQNPELLWRQYIVEILVDNKVYANGRDFSIKGAEQLASGKAMEKLNAKVNRF